MKGLRFDPQWSIDAATHWCARPEWVYWDTTPFNAIFRDAGSILGKYYYDNMPMRCTVIFRAVRLDNCYIFLIFAQNINCGYIH